MAKLTWDLTGQRRYETGVDRGVLYIPNGSGVYTQGFAWNGLTGVTETPSGAEDNKQYADNRVYANIRSAEEFGGTIEALTYPDEFGQCDGSAEPVAGISVGQQNRTPFGLAYRTKVGNDLDPDAGYKLHLVYGATAAPSEKAYSTVNDSPEAMGLSWEFSTDPVDVPGNDPRTSKPYKPTSILTLDSTVLDPTAMATLEARLYGTSGTDPDLPLPGDVIAMFSGSVTLATPTVPTYNGTTHVITIPTVTGVTYSIDDEIVSGTVTLTSGQTKIVVARPNTGYKFSPVIDDDWMFTY